MRVFLIATVALAGCASSGQLSQDANVHMADARRAADAGDYGRARDEQRRAEYAHQRAAERARDEGRPTPPPPDGAPLPIFDPQMQR